MEVKLIWSINCRGTRETNVAARWCVHCCGHRCLRKVAVIELKSTLIINLIVNIARVFVWLFIRTLSLDNGIST